MSASKRLAPSACPGGLSFSPCHHHLYCLYHRAAVEIRVSHIETHVRAVGYNHRRTLHTFLVELDASIADPQRSFNEVFGFNKLFADHIAEHLNLCAPSGEFHIVGDGIIRLDCRANNLGRVCKVKNLRPPFILVVKVLFRGMVSCCDDAIGMWLHISAVSWSPKLHRFGREAHRVIMMHRLRSTFSKLPITHMRSNE